MLDDLVTPCLISALGYSDKITKRGVFRNVLPSGAWQNTGEMKTTMRGLKAGIKGFFRSFGPGQYEAGGGRWFALIAEERPLSWRHTSEAAPL
jgi:hypothetical protein